ncbi:MAG: type II secretion system protein [Fimbriiglobus sp.]
MVRTGRRGFTLIETLFAFVVAGFVTVHPLEFVGNGLALLPCFWHS